MAKVEKIPNFKSARRHNTEYQNVYGAHRFVNHPSHEELAANQAVWARQSYSTPQIQANWEDVNRWGLQGLMTQKTGQQGLEKTKMVRLYGMDDFARRRKKDPFSEAVTGPEMKMKMPSEKRLYDRQNMTAGYATLAVGAAGLMAFII